MIDSILLLRIFGAIGHGRGLGRGLLEKRSNLPTFLISIFTTTCELLVAIRQSPSVLPFQVYTEVLMQFILIFFTPKSD